MNKKLIVMMAAVATAGVLFARPGPGFHGGHGGFRGPAPVRGPGFHHHHHHHHGGWGVAGAVLGTAALVHDIVRPAPVVVPATTVYTPAPVVTTTYPAPVVTTTYAAPPPPPPPPPPVYYRAW